MISLKDGIRSLVRIDFQGRVHKQFRGTAADERCANEAKILKELEARECPYVPRLLEYYEEEDYIITTNCGRTAENTISRKKADLLFAELQEKFGIKHDDPEPRNITYDSRLGRFCIIDFELAEILPLPETPSEEVEQLTRLHWAGHSQQGRRHLTNQDSYQSFTINTQGMKRVEEQGEFILPIRAACFSVSDGVGGNNGGEFASKLVLNTLSHLIEKEASSIISEERFSQLLQMVHETLNLRARQNEHAARLSATYVGMIFQQEQLRWANVGDSRLYRFRGGELKQLSRDHNFAFRQWKRGEISEMQYRLHPRNNILFDCMGGGHERISPETGTETWKKGDRYVLCSDGIIDGMTDRKISSLLEELGDKHDAPRELGEHNELSQAFVKRAVANAGNDDTTIIIIALD